MRRARERRRESLTDANEMKRRDFLQSMSATIAGGALAPHVGGDADAQPSDPRGGVQGEPVDRRARLARHAPVVRTFESFSALSVGNGGVRLHGGRHRACRRSPTSTRSFRSRRRRSGDGTPSRTPSAFQDKDALDLYDAHGRQVPYLSGQNGPAGKWLRENPHRLSLARIGFALRATRRLGGARVRPRRRRAAAGSVVGHAREPLHARRTRGARLDLGASRRATSSPCAWRAPSWIRRGSRSRVAFPFARVTHTGDPSDWSQPRAAPDARRRPRPALGALGADARRDELLGARRVDRAARS